MLTNIKYQFSGIEAYDALPQQIPDLFTERPLIISGKFKGEAKGKLIIKGLSGDKQFSNTLEIKSNTSEKARAIKHLWAREKIRLLADYYDLRIDEKKKKCAFVGDIVGLVVATPDVDQLIEQSSKEQSYSDEDDENLDGDSDVDIIHADSD